MRSEKGRALHQQALDAQENGDFLKALHLEDEAMMAYQADGDLNGFAEIFAMRVLTLIHLGERTGEKRFFILATHEARASLDFAQIDGVPEQIALAHAAVARTLARAEMFTEAAENFDKAVDILSGIQSEHSRKAVLADFRGQAAALRVASGKLEEVENALKAIDELDVAGDGSDYEIKVWKSGIYMKLAAGLSRNGVTDEAKKYLEMAETIANSDETIKIRREQIARLRTELKL